MTLQEIYAAVVPHLLQQKARSTIKDDIGASHCAYRGANGTRCAVGCLIKDEFYHPQLEKKQVTNAWVIQALIDSGVIHGLLPVHATAKTELPDNIMPEVALMKRLQQVHDGIVPGAWEHYLKVVGHDFGLQWPEGV